VQVQDRALQKIGDKDLWTRELDAAVARGDVQFVVHSLKDLPTQLPPGMVLGAITERADPRDVVLFHPRYPAGTTLATLPAGATVGTSSLRRAAQLQHALPALSCSVIVRVCHYTHTHAQTHTHRLMGGWALAHSGVI
jgi:hydroxymethylbilane synthase